MTLVLEGKVVHGIKRGAVFVERYDEKIKEACGFSPFPGTLNVECAEAPELPVHSNFIPSWTQMGMEYGSVRCYPCTVNGLPGALLVPDKAAHPPNVLEIISIFCLKTRLGVKEGDFVRVEVFEPER